MVDVRVASAGELARVEADLVALLDERYGSAPWHESPAENTTHARHLVQAASAVGTVVAIARDGERLVGLAQGWPGGLFAADLRAADPAAARGWDPPLFELHQLLVTHTMAGTGIGGRLHDTVMDRVGGSALLLTHPEAAAAVALYERRGWVLLAHTSFGPSHPRLVLGRRPPPPSQSR